MWAQNFVFLFIALTDKALKAWARKCLLGPTASGSDEAYGFTKLLVKRVQVLTNLEQCRGQVHFLPQGQFHFSQHMATAHSFRLLQSIQVCHSM